MARQRHRQASRLVEARYCLALADHIPLFKRNLGIGEAQAKRNKNRYQPSVQSLERFAKSGLGSCLIAAARPVADADRSLASLLVTASQRRSWRSAVERRCWRLVLCSAVPWLFVRGRDGEETWSKSQSFSLPQFLTPWGTGRAMPKRGSSPIPALCGVTPIRRLADVLQHHTSTPHSHRRRLDWVDAVMAPRRIAACFAVFPIPMDAPRVARYFRG